MTVWVLLTYEYHENDEVLGVYESLVAAQEAHPDWRFVLEETDEERRPLKYLVPDDAKWDNALQMHHDHHARLERWQVTPEPPKPEPEKGTFGTTDYVTALVPCGVES